MKMLLRRWLCFFCWGLGPGWLMVHAQSPAEFLLLSDDSLRGDVYRTEAVLDLVQAYTLDSVMSRARQRHTGFLGWTARHVFARYWQLLDTHKRKYVGTLSRRFKVYDGILREVDLNIFMMPHLPHYVGMVADGFDRAQRPLRSEKHFRYDQPDYPCPEELRFKDLGYLTVECEVTPHASRREELAARFLPTSEGKHDLTDHPNFGLEYPSMGVYGPWCLDCNHNCRPEIHPVEWLWWLDMSPDRPGGPQAKSWMIALFRDGTERFNDWSPSPIAGRLSIPLAVPAGQVPSLELELISHDAARPELLDQMVPASSEADIPAAIPLDMGRVAPLRLKGKFPPGLIRVEAEAAGELEGLSLFYLHLYAAVDNVLALRLTVDYPDAEINQQ